MKRHEMRSHARKGTSMRISCEVKPAGGLKTLLMKAVVLNISPGGAMVVAERPLDPGNVVMLGFKAGETSVEVPALAQVKWSGPAGKKDCYRTGLEFLR